MKSPLRYPGGKTRAVKTIMEFIPADCGELCSPFLGGGSIELALAERGIIVHGYDVFAPLMWFWKALLGQPWRLAKECEKFRSGPHTYIYKGKPVMAKGLLKEDFEQMRIDLRRAIQKPRSFRYEHAARFYAINRSSFSGATFSGGWSQRASYARFTESSIERIKNFKEPNLKVGQLDFRESIDLHPNAFLYLDPPYLLGKARAKLYGDKGSAHVSFEHTELRAILDSRQNWILSYNDCPEIREMYQDYEIHNAAWTYGMNKSKKSSEIIITNLTSRPYLSYYNRTNKWNEVLEHIDCRGYYTEKPCRSKTCNPIHDYCARHKKLLQPKGEVNGQKSPTKTRSSINARPNETCQQKGR